MTTNEIMSVLSAILANAEKFKNVYFWRPEGSAASRRSLEKCYSIPEYTFNYAGHEYKVSYTVTCTCSHTEASGRYYKDGKKTNLTTIKNLHKKLSEEGVVII